MIIQFEEIGYIVIMFNNWAKKNIEESKGDIQKNTNYYVIEFDEESKKDVILPHQNSFEINYYDKD